MKAVWLILLMMAGCAKAEPVPPLMVPQPPVVVLPSEPPAPKPDQELVEQARHWSDRANRLLDWMNGIPAPASDSGDE